MRGNDFVQSNVGRVSMYNGAIASQKFTQETSATRRRATMARGHEDFSFFEAHAATARRSCGFSGFT